MSRFVNREATDIITLANGDTVRVRQRLTGKEQAQMQGRLFHMEFDSEEKTTKLSGEWAAQQLEVCRSYVLGWDFKDDQGNEVPFKIEQLDEVDQDTIEEIAKGIDGLQTARKEATEKNAPKRLPK